LAVGLDVVTIWICRTNGVTGRTVGGREWTEICLYKYLGFDPAVVGYCKLKVLVAGRRKVEINLVESLRIVAFHFDVCHKTILSKTYFFSK